MAQRNTIIAGTVIVWITAVLLADVSGGRLEQYLLGALTWLLVAILLRGETVVVRAQVLAAIAFATLMELAGSGLLQVYTYRLQNIPSYVPPGHGLVYFAALACARMRMVERHVRALRWGAIVLCGSWSIWGVFWSTRSDLLGAALFVVFAMCLFVGRMPAVYIAAFAITTQLELLGTLLGNWIWDAHAGWFTAGNPPSAVVAGYCVIDAVGTRGGALLLSWYQRARAGILNAGRFRVRARGQRQASPTPVEVSLNA